MGESVSGNVAETAPEEAVEAEPENPEPLKSMFKDMGPWVKGDKIDPGKPGVAPIEILEVHANGTGEVCGSGKRASLRYVAMNADGSVLDPGKRPFTFRVGAREAIAGWDVIVAKMRVGDSFTLTIPQELAYGPARSLSRIDRPRNRDRRSSDCPS